MVLTFISATVIYLIAAWIVNLVIITLFGFIDIWLKNSGKNDREFSRIYTTSKIFMMLVLIYINLLMVTLLTKYFYDLNEPSKVHLACVIPILLAISLLHSVKKTSREATIKEYNEGRFENDINPLISYEMQKTRDEMTGFGSAWGLILFLVYYFFPNIFTACLDFFFLA